AWSGAAAPAGGGSVGGGSLGGGSGGGGSVGGGSVAAGAVGVGSRPAAKKHGQQGGRPVQGDRDQHEGHGPAVGGDQRQHHHHAHHERGVEQRVLQGEHPAAADVGHIGLHGVVGDQLDDLRAQPQRQGAHHQRGGVEGRPHRELRGRRERRSGRHHEDPVGACHRPRG